MLKKTILYISILLLIHACNNMYDWNNRPYLLYDGNLVFLPVKLYDTLTFISKDNDTFTFYVNEKLVSFPLRDFSCEMWDDNEVAEKRTFKSVCFQDSSLKLIISLENNHDFIKCESTQLLTVKLSSQKAKMIMDIAGFSEEWFEAEHFTHKFSYYFNDELFSQVYMDTNTSYGVYYSLNTHKLFGLKINGVNYKQP